ncbi:ethanolamine utilization microcompartment protein EutL [Brochothrix thermosphacta]|uniref:ethanolamine utilization microcompartment protein EutL n=1 Tax=Brochothrix thermosphacta TaxID=2756 RepID=UPI0039B0973F
MKADRLGTTVLSAKIISNVDEAMAKQLNLNPAQRSLGIITADCDDVTYIALDEATKAVPVDVVYAHSFYGGAGNAKTKLAGEVIGIIAGPSPAEVKSGLDVVLATIENGPSFISANDDDSVPYLAYCIVRTGSHLAKEANITEGEAIAYLIAPPMEALYALDFALKAADVSLAAFYGPPSETNFGGALLTGSQSACSAACDAFERAVIEVAENPLNY